MGFAEWFNNFVAVTRGDCMLNIDQLLEAYDNGKTPEQAAKANDVLAVEYSDVSIAA